MNIFSHSPFLASWKHLALPQPSMRFYTIPNFDLLSAFTIHAVFTSPNVQSLNTYSTSLKSHLLASPPPYYIYYTCACTLPTCVYITYRLYSLIKTCRSRFSSIPCLLQFSHLSSHSRQNGWLVNAYVYFILLLNILYALYQQ